MLGTMYILQEQKFLLPGIFHSREAGEGGRAQQLYSIYIQVVVVLYGSHVAISTL